MAITQNYIACNLRNNTLNQQILNTLWYTNTPYKYLLTPLSKIYETIVITRKKYYKKISKKHAEFQFPIIVIGNLTVGGTGKTPLTIWLANYLKQQGYYPGIVSRGYGGKAFIYPQTVTDQSDPAIVGDEPVLIAQQTQCPVIVDPNRVNAVHTLLKNHTCNVVISDDGLQHYALARDMEILVIDGERRFGNGLCLPAGPLREPQSRSAEVDFIVTNGTAKSSEFQMMLKPEAINNVINPSLTKPAIEFVGHIVHAIAGIGNPRRFFQSLRLMGLTIVEHIYPDHYYFSPSDFKFGNNAIIIMTEKDAIKCRTFAHENYWCLPVRAELTDEFGKQLLAKLKVIVNH